MKSRVQSVGDVAAWRLCTGCGACAWTCPEGNIHLHNFKNDGIRPVVNIDKCKKCNTCLNICPGVRLPGWDTGNHENTIESLRIDWGPILEIWEGYAVDRRFRYLGSSGGVATATALYCLQKGGIDQVIHTGAAANNPVYNHTFVSRTAEEILQRTGSRYSPASPCEGLSHLLSSNHSSVFIGKPCDIHGVREAQAIYSQLVKSVHLAISIFCAGTPSSAATQNLIESQSINIQSVNAVRYRGRGWPGNFTIWTDNKDMPAAEIPYIKAWGYLQKYRPFRCYLCPDGTGELSDISCGDPWHRNIDGSNGYSLILIRTERGREVFYNAVKEGFIKADKVDPDSLPLSQPGFPSKRGAIWGRLLAMKMFNIPIPEYDGWPLYQCWSKLKIKDKSYSFLGTIKRILQRKYYIPVQDK